MGLMSIFCLPISIILLSISLSIYSITSLVIFLMTSS